MNIIALDAEQAAVLWQSGREEDGDRVNEVKQTTVEIWIEDIPIPETFENQTSGFQMGQLLR